MKRLVVAAAIVDSMSAPTRVLAARRTIPEPLAGRWEFPGGKVEPGETVEQALRREIKEELAADLVIGTEVVNPDPGPWPLGQGLEMRVFLATLDNGCFPRTNAEHDEVRWLDTEEILDLDWLPQDRPIAQSLRGIMMLLN